MKKRIISLLLALSVLLMPLLLSACHRIKPPASFYIPEGGLDENKTYEISFWLKNDSNPTQVAAYENAEREFEKIYPNINVTIRRFKDYGELYQEVLINLRSSTPPNVCMTYPDHVASYGADFVVPLDELISDGEWGLGGSKIKFDAPRGEDMIDKFMDEGKIGGVQYAIPFLRSTEACYVNKTYVEALGYTLPELMTWDFIFEVSSAAMAKNADGSFAVNGQKKLIPFIYKSTDNMMIQMLKQKGEGNFSDDDGNILIFNDDTEEILGMVEDAAKERSFSTFAIDSYPGNWFNKGQCIFAIDSTAGATWMGPDAPLIDVSESELVNFEVEVLPIPQFDVDNPKMISQGPSLSIFNTGDTGEVLASWVFLQFLLTNDVQIDIATTEGYIPTTKKAQESDRYREYLSRMGEDNEEYYDVKIKASKVMLDNIDNTFITPVFNGSTALRNTAGALIEGVVKSARRKEIIDDKYLTALYNKLISQYSLEDGAGKIIWGGTPPGATPPTEGELPAGGESQKTIPPGGIVLIISLAAVWGAIIAYVATRFIIVTLKKRNPGK